MSNRPTSSNMADDDYEVPRGTDDEEQRGTEYEDPRGAEYEEPRGTEYEGMQNTQTREQVYEGLLMEQPRVEPRKCEVPKRTKWCLGVVSLLVLLCIVIAAMVAGFLLLHQNMEKLKNDPEKLHGLLTETIDGKIEELKQQNDLLQKNMSEQILDSKHQRDLLQENMEAQKQQLDLLQDELNKVRSLTAFHVYMNQGAIYVNNSDVIPFNRVITNIGGGFNRTTYKFRCPASGIYAFFMTGFTGELPYNGKNQTWGDLMMDGKRLTRIYCRNEGSDLVHMMCSNQVVTKCEAGSNVWVQSGHNDFKLWGGRHQETTFSGFILKQD